MAVKLPKSFISSDGVKMVLIPKGSFLMGSEYQDIPSSHPVHKVHLNTYYMDEHLVTNAQFTRFLNDIEMDENDKSSRRSWVVLRSDLDVPKQDMLWPTEIGFERGKYFAYGGFESYPVMTVSWEAADRYCKWADKRLPTEAQWEKAARGGLKQEKYPWGSSLPTTGVVFDKGWLDNLDPPPLEPAKSGMPNKFGLYHMAGMLWEWCSDWFHPGYYQDSPKKDPPGPENGVLKSMRGGAWFNPANHLRIALRNRLVPMAMDETTGFRCVSDGPSTGEDIEKADE